jgi:hypothetical protein
MCLCRLLLCWGVAPRCVTICMTVPFEGLYALLYLYVSPSCHRTRWRSSGLNPRSLLTPLLYHPLRVAASVFFLRSTFLETASKTSQKLARPTPPGGRKLEKMVGVELTILGFADLAPLQCRFIFITLTQQPKTITPSLGLQLVFLLNSLSYLHCLGTKRLLVAFVPVL